jgi:NAD(P)-dependent dehydrogenase (short-subunit alcohol dehydrogenase family)
MDLELADKVAVVTGASKGIGLAVARELAAEGAWVVAGARGTGSLEGIEHVTPYAVDLTDPDGPARLIGHALERYGRIDVLVNNVGGVHLRLDGFLSTTDADFQGSLELNFFSALRATREAVAVIVEQGGGTIVNVAWVNAFFQPDGAVIDYGQRRRPSSTSPRRSRRSSGRAGSGSPASPRGRWRPTSGWARMAWRRRSAPLPAPAPMRSASR